MSIFKIKIKIIEIQLPIRIALSIFLSQLSKFFPIILKTKSSVSSSHGSLLSSHLSSKKIQKINSLKFGLKR